MQFFIKATENAIALEYTVGEDSTVLQKVIARGQMFEWDGTLIGQSIPEGTAVPSPDGNAGSGYIERRVSGIIEADDVLPFVLKAEIKEPVAELPEGVFPLPDDGPKVEIKPETKSVSGTGVTSLAEAIEAAKQPETAPAEKKKAGRKSNAQKEAEALAAESKTDA